MSGRVPRRDDRKVDLGLRNGVDVVGPNVEDHVLDDLDDLRVRVARGLDCTHVLVANVTALAHYAARKTHSGIRFCIVRCAAAIRRHLGIIEMGDVLAEVRVRREAIIATVELGNSKSNAFASSHRHFALAEGTRQADITFERSWARGNHTEHIRHAAEF
jgi:hypothetical protein